MAIPTMQEAREWMDMDDDAGNAQLTDSMLTRIYNSEILNQKRVCAVPLNAEDYPDDLGQALLRRVARAVALKGITLGVITGIADGSVGMTRVSGIDREIQRLEAPFKKLATG